MTKAILLIGHGGVPKDMPRSILTELRRCEALARGDGAEAEGALARAHELDNTMRHWPRNEENDAYRLGVEALAEAMRARAPETEVVVAYNEFCAPTVGEALDDLVARGSCDVSVVTTMMVSGGSHGQIDIPAALDEARERHPELTISYHWPVPPERLASMLVALVAEA